MSVARTHVGGSQVAIKSRHLVALSLVLVAIADLAILIGAKGFEETRFAMDVAALLIPLLVLPFASRGWTGYSKLLFGIATLCVLGQFATCVDSYILGTGYPSSAGELLWISAYILGVVAVIKWPLRTNQSSLLRHNLEALILAIGIFLPAWVFKYGNVATGELTVSSMEVVYLVLDLIILAGAIQAVARGFSAKFRRTNSAVIGSVICFALPDIITSADPNPNLLVYVPFRMLWVVGVCLLFATTVFYAEELEAKTEENGKPCFRSTPLWRLAVPYGSLPFALGLFAYVVCDSNKSDLLPVTSAAVVTMTFLIVVRHMIALADNSQLVGQLVKAKSELEERHEEVTRSNEDLHDVLERLTQKNRELGIANEQLARLVTVDGMTGLANHRAFHERLRLEMESARKYNYPLTIILADIDHFRRYNDEYGYPAGDEVLKLIAKTLFEVVDLKAYPARVGGEEFAILMPHVTPDQAVQACQRIGESVAQYTQLRRSVTLSFGVASTQSNNWSPEVLLQESSRALDAAKSRGRNQIVLAEDLISRVMALEVGEDVLRLFDPTDPMGLAAVLSAGLRNQPQAISLEPKIQLVSGLLGMLELKDLETRDHSERVMWYAMRLAQSAIENLSVHMSLQDLRSLAYGSLLHDIGKIGVPEHILKFNGKLDAEMRTVINEHPRHGAQLVQKFPSLEMEMPVIRFHHEKWNGGGYPSGLAGREIPLVARIFAVVDALEALTSNRPYQPPVPVEKAIATILKDVGTHFDPMIITTFMAVPAEEWEQLREQERHVAETSHARVSLQISA